MEERTGKQVVRAWVVLGVLLLVWYLVAAGILQIEGRSFKDSESDFLTAWGVLGLVVLPLMMFVAGLISLIWLAERITRLVRTAASSKIEP